MAVRQYIGARYVPKWVGEWNNTTVYEPLSIVSYNNSSYTSKKAVPVGMGNPATATEYWALSGNTSGQIEEIKEDIEVLEGRVDTVEGDIDDLKARVEEAESDIDDLEDWKEETIPTVNRLKSKERVNSRTFILIADSYGITPTATTDFLHKFASKCGIAGTDRCFINPESGAGFCRVGDSGHKFIDLLNATIDSLTSEQIEKVTDVIVCGGLNDRTSSSADISTALRTFTSRVKEKLPNALTHVGFVGWYNGAPDYDLLPRTMNAYYDGASYPFNRSCYIGGIENVMHNGKYFGSDKMHPNNDGADALAQYLCNYMSLSQSTTLHAHAEVTMTAESGITLDQTKIHQFAYNGVVQTILYDPTAVVKSGGFGSHQWDGSTSFNIASIPFNSALANGYYGMKTTTNGIFAVGGAVYSGFVVFRCIAGVINITPYIIDPDGSYLTGALSNFTILPFTITSLGMFN